MMSNVNRLSEYWSACGWVVTYLPARGRAVNAGVR